MAVEDFTTYTEVDPGDDITVTSTKVTYTAIPGQNIASYVYDDKGVNHFSGDFTFEFEYYVSAAQDLGFIGTFVLANSISDIKPKYDAVEDFFFARVYKNSGGGSLIHTLVERDGGSSYTDAAHVISLSTIYYVTIDRDETIGSYGQLRMRTYSDAARTILINTQTISLHTSKKDFQYIYPLATYNSGATTNTITGYLENLDLQEQIDVIFGNQLHAIHEGIISQTAAGISGVIVT